MPLHSSPILPHGDRKQRRRPPLSTQQTSSFLFVLATCCLALSSALTPALPSRFGRRTQSFHNSCARTKLKIIPPLTNGEETRLGVQSAWMTMDSSRSDVHGPNSNNAQPESSKRSQARIDIGTSKRTRITSNNILLSPSEKSKRPTKKRKYSRKLPLTPTEKAASLTRLRRQAAYEKMRSSSLNITNEPPSIWSFDSLFPDPVLDEISIREDLYGSKKREEQVLGSRERRREREGKAKSLVNNVQGLNVAVENGAAAPLVSPPLNAESTSNTTTAPGPETSPSQPSQPIDKTLTRMVQDRIYGLTRTPAGSIQYTTSLLDSSRAVQFREGVRLGKALTINIDRLCYFAKKDLRHGKLEEAQEYYLEALGMDPTDGRPYLGLSRIAQRRGDLEYARGVLRQGISRCGGGYVQVRGPVVAEKDGAKSSRGKGNKKSAVEEGPVIGSIPDNGPNPFLLQALGALEQKTGNLATAEELYLQALRSRPSHAAAWVALAQLRTKELRQGARAGRVCYQSAENELKRIGAKPNAFVYTAWASMEYKKGRPDDATGIRRARELYQLALEADPHCSAALLQLGAMESECGNFDRAKECFETVLKFDQRNSRVLQAYAIMESRRPREDVDSRKVLELFERALKANSRDAGVYQAYALYVVQLGDIESARDLLRRGTEVDKRHAPVWQAWGVLETRYNTAKTARDIFQQGIWACAQPGGGQSGGRRCARLWQAWGVLEAQEGDHAAARRCFSRALDADPRNVAAVTAWTSMEADLGNLADARSIFERTLKLFPSPSHDKMAIWRSWEIMEERTGNTRAAQLIFQRSMRDSMSSKDDDTVPESPDLDLITTPVLETPAKPKSKEIEVSRWASEGNEWDSEVWINNGSIEGKIPAKMMKKLMQGDSFGNNRR
ncbi:hypothetical protein HJC23_012361 [Cyclotella cryptica]|uniref:PsbB mRNA maturation factor Mbb1 n=1 Tax=Cyclotella cryptica TaxID=29204 RepID=A0ABD3QD47_9STRA